MMFGLLAVLSYTSFHAPPRRPVRAWAACTAGAELAEQPAAPATVQAVHLLIVAKGREVRRLRASGEAATAAASVKELMGLKERYERLAGKEYNAVQLARAAKRRLEPVEGEASDGVPEDESVSSHLPPLPILLRSDSYVFVAKPAGTVVHRGKFTKKGDVPLVQRVRDQLGVRVNPVTAFDANTARA